MSSWSIRMWKNSPPPLEWKGFLTALKLEIILNPPSRKSSWCRNFQQVIVKYINLPIRSSSQSPAHPPSPAGISSSASLNFPKVHTWSEASSPFRLQVSRSDLELHEQTMPSTSHTGSSYATRKWKTVSCNGKSVWKRFLTAPLDPVLHLDSAPPPPGASGPGAGGFSRPSAPVTGSGSGGGGGVCRKCISVTWSFKVQWMYWRKKKKKSDDTFGLWNLRHHDSVMDSPALSSQTSASQTWLYRSPYLPAESTGEKNIK